MEDIGYIVFNKVNKQYKEGKSKVITNFDLSIEKGEFIVIVGPSGSGKSTLLQLICGLEDLTEGTIEIDNRIINNVLPRDRDVSMVFQNYALLPHLTAYENIEFGMKIRKVDKNERDKKIRWAAEILGLQELLDIKPKNLSGGQRQRVALARAMVREPKLFLMDEPLSNLDAKLRHSTSNEIKALHETLNTTTIYVTHDQIEALTMADRIVILKEGVIQQIGTPTEIYSNPNNLFVAEFIGKPEINIFDFKIKENNMVINEEIILPYYNTIEGLEEGKSYILGMRSEDIKLVNDKNSIKALIEKVEYLGGEVILYLNYKGCKFTTKTYEIRKFSLREEINVTFDFNKMNIFNSGTKENIRREKHEKN